MKENYRGANILLSTREKHRLIILSCFSINKDNQSFHSNHHTRQNKVVLALQTSRLPILTREMDFHPITVYFHLT